ncbi:MAG: 50S ribosomal protein L21 [Nitrospirae bacterium]|nr:MAG: 50S ribosomal protein L21 [Nitrospirota bacterium]
MHAVIETAGKQMRVAAGDKVVLEGKIGVGMSELVIDKVMAVSDGDNIKFGSPYLAGASVKADIVSRGRLDKVIVLKHKAKKAGKKMTGHRQDTTTLQIKEIIGG